jgi:hypothetical protein
LEWPFLHNEDGFIRAIPLSFIVTIEIAEASCAFDVGDNLLVVSEGYQVNVVAKIGTYTSSLWPDKAQVIINCLKPRIGWEYMDSVTIAGPQSASDARVIAFCEQNMGERSLQRLVIEIRPIFL